MTVPGDNAPFAGEGFNHGNRSLGVQLWPNGKLVAGRLPDGSYFADVMPDGSIEAKLGWWRDGSTGLQVSGLTFPTRGCWKVVGNVGSARLAFVVRVTTTAGSS